MARIRMIKPEFFDDPDIADLSMPARLFFIGLWTQADKAGRMVADMRRLKARIFPFDDVDCEALAVELQGKNMIRRYSSGPAVEKHGYISVRNFAKHQRPHPKEPESLIPPYDPPAVGKHGEPGKNTASPSESGVLILDSGVLSTESGLLRTAAPGRVRDEPSAPMDVWARELVSLYPAKGRCGWNMVERPLFDALYRYEGRSPVDAWGILTATLDRHKASHQWRVKGMIPRLDRWLREGMHLQELDAEAPAAEQVTARTQRTLAAAASILRGES